MNLCGQLGHPEEAIKKEVAIKATSWLYKNEFIT